jgi:hypothetical protein
MPNLYQAPSVDVIWSGLSGNPSKWNADLNRIFDVNLPKYLGDEQDGEEELYTLLTATYQKCQPTGQEPTVVLAGYSQGAMLAHNVLNQLAAQGQTGPAALVKGAVLIADPERVPLSDVVNLGTAPGNHYGICRQAEVLDASCILGNGPTPDVADYFAPTTVAVCDNGDIICDTSADIASVNPITDIQDVKHGIWVHTNCHSYCGSEVITAGRWIGRKLIADGRGATTVPSPSPSPSPTSTGTGPGTWTAMAAPEPTGATSGSLDSVTCPSTTCVATGWDSNGILIVSGSGTSWTATDTPGPVSTQPGSSIAPEGGPYVACATPSACTAVGYYQDSATGPSSTYSYLLTGGVGGSWTLRQPPLPTNALAGGDVDLRSVACPSATQCVAVGTYTDSSYNTEGLVLTGSGSSWQATEAPLPADASGTDQNTQLFSVACSSSQCVIGGGYAVAGSGTDPAYSAALVLTGSGSSWTASAPPVPANAIADATNLGVASGIDQVTCPASGCVALGQYMDTSKAYEAMVLTQSGTSWTAVEPPLPDNTSGTGLGSALLGLGCASASACTAWGIYDYAENTAQARIMTVTGFGTSWQASDIAAGGGSVGADAGLDVACLSATVCTALDPYDADPGLLITGSGSAWTATTAPLPSDAQSTEAHLYAIACSSAQCVSVGTYWNSADDQEGLLDIEPSH